MKSKSRGLICLTRLIHFQLRRNEAVAFGVRIGKVFSARWVSALNPVTEPIVTDGRPPIGGGAVRGACTFPLHLVPFVEALATTYVTPRDIGV